MTLSAIIVTAIVLIILGFPMALGGMAIRQIRINRKAKREQARNNPSNS